MTLKKSIYLTLSSIFLCTCALHQHEKVTVEPFHNVDKIIMHGDMTDCVLQPPKPLQKEVTKELNFLRQKSWQTFNPLGKGSQGVSLLTIHHHVDNKKTKTLILLDEYSMIELSRESYRALSGVSGLIAPNYNQDNMSNTIRLMKMYNTKCTNSVT